MSKIIGTIHSDKGFYIGDICYVLADAIYHDIWGGKHGYKDGVYTVPGEELKFAVAGTAYGDGDYFDNDCHEYGVDAGILGLVPIELVSKDGSNLGRIIDGAGDATFEAEDGYFTITLPNGKVVYIDTTEEEDYDEEDY